MSSEIQNFEPVVSVCMITYNHAPYIARAIESVLAQETDFPFELVIGDDFSTDGTRNIVLKYAQRFPHIIRITPHRKNVGALINESLTEELCRGNYIAYCEGDDFWHENDKLQTQCTTFKKNPKIGLVYSDYDRFFPSSGITIKAFNRHTNNTPPQSISIEQIVRGGKHLYILTCTVMLKRALLKEVLNSDDFLFRQKDRAIRDTSVWVEIAARSKIAYINRSLATYTVNTESASKSKIRIRRLKFTQEVREIELHLARKHGFPQTTIREFERNWGKACLRLALHSQSQTGAQRAWETLRHLNPGFCDYIIYWASLCPPLRVLAATIEKLNAINRR